GPPEEPLPSGDLIPPRRSTFSAQNHARAGDLGPLMSWEAIGAGHLSESRPPRCRPLRGDCSIRTFSTGLPSTVIGVADEIGSRLSGPWLRSACFDRFIH